MRTRLLEFYGPISAILAATGIVFIVVSEVWHLDWLRIFGAIMITSGAVGVGSWYGLAVPRRWPLQQAARHWRRAIGIISAIVMTMPVIVALLAAMAGLLDDEGRTGSSAIYALGGLIALSLTVAVVVTLAVGLRAIDRSTYVTPRAVEEPNGPTA